MGAGPNVVFVTGRDRQLILNEEMRTNDAPATVQARHFDEAVRSVAIGEFDDRQGKELGVLFADGTVQVLGQARTRTKKRLGLLGMSKAAALEESWPDATGLVSAKVSVGRGDDLVVLDPANQGLHVVMRAESGEGTKKGPATRQSIDGRGTKQHRGGRLDAVRLPDPLGDLVDPRSRPLCSIDREDGRGRHIHGHEHRLHRLRHLQNRARRGEPQPRSRRDPVQPARNRALVHSERSRLVQQGDRPYRHRRLDAARLLSTGRSSSCPARPYPAAPSAERRDWLSSRAMYPSAA